MTDILQDKEGTYVCAYYTTETKNSLRSWFKASGLGRHRIAVQTIHTTLLYSRKKLLRAYDQVGPRTIVASPLRFAMFDSVGTTDQSVLVLVLDCLEFKEMHADFLAMGGTNDRPFYNPHITLSHKIPECFDMDTLKLPEFDFVTSAIFAEPLELDWCNHG